MTHVVIVVVISIMFTSSKRRSFKVLTYKFCVGIERQRGFIEEKIQRFERNVALVHSSVDGSVAPLTDTKSVKRNDKLHLKVDLQTYNVTIR